MLRGLAALHELKICHRDLKCANIFLTADGVIKLGDLNVSKVAKKGLLYTQTGTPYYASPEVWQDKPYDSKCDIWSLGCVVYEVATLQPPFRAPDMKGLCRKIIAGQFSPPSKYSKDLQYVLKQMLQVRPNYRPSAAEILRMPEITFHTTDTLTNIDGENAKAALGLLGTIEVPRDLSRLRNKLPKPQYDQPL